jgi:hypothetical protein
VLNVVFHIKERKKDVLENRVLRIFQPKRDEVNEDCKKLDNEEIHDL